MFIEELGEKLIKDDTEFIAENKDKYISFIVKIIAKLTWVTNKHGKNLYIRIFSWGSWTVADSDSWHQI